MRSVRALLENITIPELYRVRQEFHENPLLDIEKTCLDQLESYQYLQFKAMVVQIASIYSVEEM